MASKPLPPRLTEESFERLWTDAERTAWRVACQCGASRRREDREDLLQRIRLRAWRARDSFDSERSGAFERWIARIAARTCLDSIRESYRFRRLSIVDVPDLEDGTQVLETIPSDEPSALEEILAEERMQDLRSGMAEMPPTLRRALDLTIQGLTPAEIAQRLGIEANTVRAQLVRARQWMRRRVG